MSIHPMLECFVNVTSFVLACTKLQFACLTNWAFDNSINSIWKVIHNHNNNQITLITVSDTALPPYDSLTRHMYYYGN